ncbi:uncharacterized protein LOC141619492 [Silene latifolia]|uniref:uncharacterized protein LOC141619492 n=1 Tax=Silene latifolia TaxID=37657 RepID=UPI003D786A21
MSTSLIRYAITSRILIVTLIIVWRSIFSPYDTSASLNPNCLSPSPSDSSPHSVIFPGIGSAIETSVVWDSVYFLRIAQCGYEYEQTYAFLPLLPVLIFLVSNSVFRPLIPVIGYRAVLALSGYVINNLAFVLAALYFYRLSIAILKDKDASLRASILFCFNPASIFYSSIYTESLYALCSIGGVYYLISGANNTSVLLLSLSSFARSNGVINAGYCGFKMLHQAYHAVYVKKRSLLAVKVLLAGVFRCICICLPFLAFQAYGYYNLCHGLNTDEMRPWCRTKVPLLYSFIQSQYWGVGFLRYFQLKQSPNFLLASPVLSLAFCSIFSYLKFEPEKFFSLGFGIASKENNSANEPFSRGEEQRFDDHRAAKQDLRRRQQSAKPRVKSSSAAEKEVSVKGGYYTMEMLPFIYHLSFMAATALFVMHVQVSTRFLSASPPLYWYASYLMGCIERRRWAYLIWAYAASYIFLGSLLFSNFYPFT